MYEINIKSDYNKIVDNLESFLLGKESKVLKKSYQRNA